MSPFSSHRRRKLGRIKGLAFGLATATLLAGCGVAGASPSPTSVASASSSAISPLTQPSAPTPKPSPNTPQPTAATFTTPGVTSNWTGFSWSSLSAGNPLATADPGVRLLSWRGGYAAYGTTNGWSSGLVWTSVDGQTWTQVTAIVAPRVLVAAAPAGLVALADDPSAASPSETVWTSSDGLSWHAAGSPSGLAFVDSLAGTSAGLVATGHTLTGSGKSATSGYYVAYSNDGVNWTPVTVQKDITWDYVGPYVQSGDGRFFVMGGYTVGVAKGAAYRLDALGPTGAPGGRGLVGSGAAGTGGLWWSDDGLTWTATGDWVYAAEIEFGRDGMLLQTSGRMIPGGTGLDISTDGGKSWQADNNYAPLGATVCGQGECSYGPDGVITSNGTVFLAVKTNGKAWVSYDGKTWTPVAWDSPFPFPGYSILVLPRGVVVGTTYGAAN